MARVRDIGSAELPPEARDVYQRFVAGYGPFRDQVAVFAHCPPAVTHLMGLLRDALGERPYIGDIRGRGYFIGIELVAERASKEPFPPSLQLFARVRDQSFANGLICYPTGGNVDGVKGDQIILAPPYNASRAELDEIVDKLQQSLSEVMAALPKKR